MVLAGEYPLQWKDPASGMAHPMVPDAALPLLVLSSALFLHAWYQRRRDSARVVLERAM